MAQPAHSPLLSEVDAFLKHPAVSMTETTFGRLSVNDGKFVGRLRAGRRVWPETAEKAREFMRKACPALYEPDGTPKPPPKRRLSQARAA